MFTKEMKERISAKFRRAVELQKQYEEEYPGFTKYFMALSSIKTARGARNEIVKPGDILECAEAFEDMNAAKAIWYPAFLSSIDDYLSSK